MNDSMMGKKLNEILKFVYVYLIKMGASKEDAEDIIQDTAYKFLQYIDSVQFDNIQSWLFRVAGGNYQDDTEKIINNITNQGKMKLEPQNLKIIGVVVTGKPSDLIKFSDESMIRGATLGATTDQY